MPRSAMPGKFVGLANFISLAHDSVFWLSCSTRSSTRRSPASIKFPLGLYLALLLNRRLPFKSFLRAIVLLPFVVPTVLSAIAFWWIFDRNFPSSHGRW
jgi:multiple sugar transport system permease protein